MNFEKYVGIPYVEKGRDETGVDCWGLVRLVYKNELNINLPSFSSEYETSDNERLEELFAQYKEGWEATDKPELGDVVIFRIFGYESHIGLCIGDDKFLHVREAKDTVIESLTNPKWSKRITGFFKYSEKSNAVLNTIPHPLRTERYTLGVVPGTTVAELVTNISSQYNIAIELKSRINILINGRVIPQENWSTTVVKDIDVIEYRAVPGKTALKIIALIVLIQYAPDLALEMLGTEFGAYTASAIGQGVFLTAAQVSVTLAGSALINAVAPIRPPVQTQPNDPGSAERQLMVNGGPNRGTPYGAIPVVLGKVRMTPLLGSNNFVTYENERDSYLSMLLVWGYGPLSIDDTSYKIGEVPLSNYDANSITKINDSRITELTTDQKRNFDAIYGKDITQVNTQVELVCDGNPESTVTPGSWFQAATIEAVNSVTLALHFPQGLRMIKIKGSDAGDSFATSVQFRAEYSTNGGSTWLLLESFTIGGDTVKKDGFTFTKTYSGLNHAQMIVRVRRETGDNTEDNPERRYYFTSILQNITFLRNENPAVDPVGAKIAKTAFKINATKELNGSIQGINTIVQTYCKIWNGTAWVDGTTSNPAALMRYVLEHPANPRKITDAASEINLTQLQYFYNYCATKGFEYNGVLGQARSVLEVIRDICAAGRASPALIDGKWTVVIDEVKPNVVQHFTPHNSWGFEGSKPLPKRPDGLRVTYYDQDQDYQQAEIIVYDVDKNINNASLFESITLPGVTKKSLVIDHAKWHMAQMKLRPEIYTLNSDIEYLVCNRGDRVKVMHDVPLWGLGSGRIKDVYNNLTVYSEELNTSWTNGTSATWQYSSALSPENTLTALGVDGLNGTNISATGTTLYQAVTGLTIGKSYTFSAYVRTKVGTHPGIRIRLEQTGNSVIGPSVPVNETWQRVSLTVSATTTSITCLVGSLSIGNFYIWGAMLNEGTTAQPYVKSTAIKGCSLLLDEEVPMEANGVYTMRFRSKLGGSVTRTLIPKSTNGNYNKVDLTSPVTTSEADVLDLFLFGELNQESQDLLVLSIEPSGNNSARLVMVDYGVTSDYNIFTDYLTLSASTVFESQITLPPTLQISGFGTKIPIITGFVSDESVMDRVAKGIFKYNINVSYFNASGLPNETESVEVQYDLLNSTTGVNSRSVIVPFQKGSATITDVKEGETYKVRMRYISPSSSRIGNWTAYSNHTVVGKTNPPSEVTGFTVTADKPSGQLLLSWYANLEPDVSTYEIRTEDTGWGIEGYTRVFYGDTTKAYTKYGTSGSINFYIRAVDSSGNYSLTSSVANLTSSVVPNITDIAYSYADTALTSATVTLSWSEVTTSRFEIDYYELTYDTTTRNIKANSITLPADWIGDRTFVIKTVDIHGNKSSGYSESVSKITPNPPYDLRAQVIDNNVMLYWTLPERTSLPIDHVLIKKGLDWNTAQIVGDKKGAFTTINENQGGEYTYWLAAVDTEGVESTPVSVKTLVSEPPDFVFHGEFESNFGATKSSAYLENNYVILPVNTTETFQQHFTTRSWTTPQDQVTAGYPVYIQPSTTSGYYEEVFDFGQPLASSKVSLIYQGSIVSGSPIITPMISLSLDNSTYVDYNGATDVFGLNFRYVKVRITVTTALTTGLYQLTSILVRLDAKLKNDAGNISALSTDTLGTIVNFNKEFIDVQSITLAPSGTTPLIPVYDVKDAFVSGTYSVVSNVCTVTISNHGMITGQKVKLFTTTGALLTGVYTITGYTTNSFTVAASIANTSGDCSMYPQSFRVYLFDNSGSRVSSTTSWSIKGY